MIDMIGMPTIVIGLLIVVNIVAITVIQATGNLVPPVLTDTLPLLVTGFLGVQVPSGRSSTKE